MLPYALPASQPAGTHASCAAQAAAQQLQGSARTNFLARCQPASPPTAPAPEAVRKPPPDKASNCATDSRGRPLRGTERRSFIRSYMRSCQSAVV